MHGKEDAIVEKTHENDPLLQEEGMDGKILRPPQAGGGLTQHGELSSLQQCFSNVILGLPRGRNPERAVTTRPHHKTCFRHHPSRLPRMCSRLFKQFGVDSLSPASFRRFWLAIVQSLGLISSVSHCPRESYLMKCRIERYDIQRGYPTVMFQSSTSLALCTAGPHQLICHSLFFYKICLPLLLFFFVTSFLFRH